MTLPLAASSYSLSWGPSQKVCHFSLWSCWERHVPNALAFMLCLYLFVTHVSLLSLFTHSFVSSVYLHNFLPFFLFPSSCQSSRNEDQTQLKNKNEVERHYSSWMASSLMEKRWFKPVVSTPEPCRAWSTGLPHHHSRMCVFVVIISIYTIIIRWRISNIIMSQYGGGRSYFNFSSSFFCSVGGLCVA